MNKLIKTLLLSIFLLITISIFSNVKAATATLKASSTNVNVGDSVSVSININAATWNLKVSGASGGPFVGYTQSTNNEAKTEKATVDTSSPGTKTITLSGDVTDGDTGVTSTINTSVIVMVNEKPVENNNEGGNEGGSQNNNNSSKSADNSLKSITVGGESYKVGDTKTVDADTSAIEIKATPNSSKAKVSGTGTKELETGTNNFIITVTAENGAKKTYKVTIVREEYIDDNPNVIDPNQEIEDLRLTTLEIENSMLSPIFDKEIFEYYADIINQDYVKINAIANAEDASIEVIGNNDLVEGENIVTIRVTKEEKSIDYQITVTRKTVEETNVEPEKGISTGAKIAIAVGIIIVIAVVVVIIKKRNRAEIELDVQDIHRLMISMIKV